MTTARYKIFIFCGRAPQVVNAINDTVIGILFAGPEMATDIRTSELKEPIDVAEYLFRRLHEVGVRGVHGVPGDFNLVSLFLILGQVVCCTDQPR